MRAVLNNRGYGRSIFCCSYLQHWCCNRHDERRSLVSRVETGGTPSDGLVARGADTSIDAAIEGVLAVARREILLLSSALQSDDHIMSLVAAGRLRWSLSCAHDFAARSPFALSRMRERLKE